MNRDREIAALREFDSRCIEGILGTRADTLQEAIDAWNSSYWHKILEKMIEEYRREANLANLPLLPDEVTPIPGVSFVAIDMSKAVDNFRAKEPKEQPLWATNYKLFKEQYWQRCLGFEPEAKFEEDADGSKCRHCGGKSNVRNQEASAWSSKLKCDDCEYFTYINWTDRMGGGLHDEVAYDKRDAKI